MGGLFAEEEFADASRPSTGATDPKCAWCPKPIPRSARRDSIYCSKRCRQAAHRFRRGYDGRRPDDTAPLRLAYADPPYPGNAHLYRDHPDFGGEVDHVQLVRDLRDGFPDGWALSTSAQALQDVLAICTAEGVRVRVASWHKGERPTKSYGPLNAWEPVLFTGGRASLATGATRRVDTLVYHARARLTDSERVIGAKPAEFLWWLFNLLGAQPQDDLVDLFPGSGGVSRAWAIFQEGPPPPPLMASARARGDASVQEALV